MCQASTPQVGPHSAHGQSGSILDRKEQGQCRLARFALLPRCGSPYLSDLERCLGIAPSPGEMKSPALAGAGRFRGYGLTPPRPCQGRPQCQLSGRSSCLCEGLQARSNWLTTGCPSRPGQIPLWASSTPSGPKHLESKPDGRSRGRLEALQCAGSRSELAIQVSYPAR